VARVVILGIRRPFGGCTEQMGRRACGHVHYALYEPGGIRVVTRMFSDKRTMAAGTSVTWTHCSVLFEVTWVRADISTSAWKRGKKKKKKQF
jgi:hypothetical protein